MKPNNIFQGIPDTFSTEIFEDLVRSSFVRVERIISKGHTSPPEGWYDQDEDEWVLLIEGKAVIEFDDGVTVSLDQGDYLNIKSHCRHRVSWTDPERTTVWLAVFYKEPFPNGSV